ncbi:hypothetical protein [Lichenicoccus roseus]|uniref:Uncharacterized protein n=1 Tax=Lichenicoccus roseus TaxID=2683649 RepID=A0A5R9J3I2_9PROT|nr:hypothetical protein [Lichenicoccus roseus]TLU72112.1 hypothetical protein FE263_13395 [Lichenicoccus roseus]
MKTAEDWRRCVSNLHHAIERLQATTDDIPPELAALKDRPASDVALLLERHLTTFGDYTVALSCLQAHLAKLGIIPIQGGAQD